MQNTHLLGVRQVDRVDLRLSFLVVALFAAITIISYVNELSRAGLLDPHRRKHLFVPRAEVHFNRHRVERSVEEYDEPHDDALIQRNGQVHQLGLEIHNIKKALNRNNGKSESSNREQEINIAVHLGKNASYLTANNSAVRVYHFNNTMPNFYTSLQVPLINIHDNSDKELNDTRVELRLWVEAMNTTRKAYKKATAVLVYQHDPGGYLTRDCLRSLVRDHHLTAPTNPLNIQYRKEWDMMPKFKRNTFKILYGGLSFGVCEGISHPCTYVLMVKHPLDRILTVYNICQKNTSSILCHFNKLNVQNMTLQQFIKVQGSSFFRKLLYYSKHCKLVGDDEICLPDTKTSFVLTSQERHIYLENILENLENWFSVIGLEEHFNESLMLFESVFGLNYTGCGKPTKFRELVKMDRHLWPLVSSTGRHTLRGLHNMSEFDQVQNVTYRAIRDKLLQDPQISKWLSADIAIYTKLEELFKKQLEVFNITQSVIKTLQNPTSYPVVVPPINRLKHGKHVKQGKENTHKNNKDKHGQTRNSGNTNHSKKHGGGHGNKQHRQNSPGNHNRGNDAPSNSQHSMNLHNASGTEQSSVAADTVHNNKPVANADQHQQKVNKKKHLDKDELMHKIEASYEKLDRLHKTLRTRGQNVDDSNLPTMQVHGVGNSKVHGNLVSTTSEPSQIFNKQLNKSRRNNKDNHGNDKKKNKRKKRGNF